jgi:hypothetical protein
MAFFISSTVSRILYSTGSGFDTAGVRTFLKSNAPGADWQGPTRDDSDNSYRWRGSVDGALAFAACLYNNGSSLVIWTQENNEHAKAHSTEEADSL